MDSGALTLIKYQVCAKCPSCGWQGGTEPVSYLPPGLGDSIRDQLRLQHQEERLKPDCGGDDIIFESPQRIPD